MLTMVHLRLQQITGKQNKPFGGVPILVVGDLYQLPPVNRKDSHLHNGFVYEDLSDNVLNQFFDSILKDENIWKKHFKYLELNENIRQQSDQDYQHLLNRMRTGALTDCDYTTLSRQLIKSKNERFIY